MLTEELHSKPPPIPEIPQLQLSKKPVLKQMFPYVLLKIMDTASKQLYPEEKFFRPTTQLRRQCNVVGSVSYYETYERQFRSHKITGNTYNNAPNQNSRVVNGLRAKMFPTQNGLTIQWFAQGKLITQVIKFISIKPSICKIEMKSLIIGNSKFSHVFPFKFRCQIHHIYRRFTVF